VLFSGDRVEVQRKGFQLYGFFRRRCRSALEGVSSELYFVRLRSGRYMRVVPGWVAK